MKTGSPYSNRLELDIDGMQKQRQQVPNTDLVMKDKPVHTSEIYSSPSSCSLTIYKAKRKKVVCIQSSMHQKININQIYKMKLPETVQYYKKSKVGDDVLDQMARYHTARVPVDGGWWLCFSTSLTASV